MDTKQKSLDKDFSADSLNIQNQSESTEIPEESPNSDDIDMIMAHTQCSRIDAIKGLKKTKGDIVLAIMNLTECPPSEQEFNAQDNNTSEILEEWLNPQDIDMVMAQAQCSRVDALKALRKSEGDMISAILDLTKDNGTEEIKGEWFEPENIDIVMAHAQCRRIDAIKALRESKGDVVSAIMNLTM